MVVPSCLALGLVAFFVVVELAYRWSFVALVVPFVVVLPLACFVLPFLVVEVCCYMVVLELRCCFGMVFFLVVWHPWISQSC